MKKTQQFQNSLINKLSNNINKTSNNIHQKYNSKDKNSFIKYLNPSRSYLKNNINNQLNNNIHNHNPSHVRSCSSITDLEVNGYSSSTIEKQKQNNKFFISSTSNLQTINDLNQTNYLNSVKKFTNKQMNNQIQKINNKNSQEKLFYNNHINISPKKLMSNSKSNIINNISMNNTQSGSKQKKSKSNNFCFSLKHLINHQGTLNPNSGKSNKTNNLHQNILNHTHSFQDQQEFQKINHNNTPFNQTKTDKNYLNKKNNSNKQNQHGNNSNNQNYELMLKLKNCIEELKKKQNKNLQQLQRLKAQNAELIDNKNYLSQKVQVLQARDLQQNKLIKKHQKQKKQMKNDNQLVVQSLKKVINQQMVKIIQLKRRQLQKQKMSKTKNKVNSHYQSYQQQEQDEEQETSNNQESEQSNQFSRYNVGQNLNDLKENPVPMSHRIKNQYLKQLQSVRQSNRQKTQDDIDMMIQSENTEDINEELGKNPDTLLQQVDSYLSKWLTYSKQ